MKKLLLVLALVSVGSVMDIQARKPLPKGPYKKLCKQCYVSNSNVLTCVCKTRDGGTTNTSLELPKGYENGNITIGNQNGTLQQLLK